MTSPKKRLLRRSPAARCLTREVKVKLIDIARLIVYLNNATMKLRVCDFMVNSHNFTALPQEKVPRM